MKGLAVDVEQRYLSLNDFLQDLTHPNPAFLAPVTESTQSRSLIFWQLMSLTWFVVAMFLIAALWLP
jgi:protein phosphatase